MRLCVFLCFYVSKIPPDIVPVEREGVEPGCRAIGALVAWATQVLLLGLGDVLFFSFEGRASICSECYGLVQIQTIGNKKRWSIVRTFVWGFSVRERKKKFRQQKKKVLNNRIFFIFVNFAREDFTRVAYCSTRHAHSFEPKIVKRKKKTEKKIFFWPTHATFHAQKNWSKNSLGKTSQWFIRDFLAASFLMRYMVGGKTNFFKKRTFWVTGWKFEIFTQLKKIITRARNKNHHWFLNVPFFEFHFSNSSLSM